jgi:hypothetical protein
MGARLLAKGIVKNDENSIWKPWNEELEKSFAEEVRFPASPSEKVVEG